MGKKKSKTMIKRNKIPALSAIIILVTIIIMTVGYSAFSAELHITDIVARIRADKVVRINGVRTSSGAVSDLDYSHMSVINNVNLAAGASITYNVDVTNLGNVPVAVSNVYYTNGNSTISTISSNIDPSHYVKICDNNNNNNCTGPVTKTVPITITNNGSEAINSRLDVFLTFVEVYSITYEGNKIGEALAGSTFTYTFPSNYPDGMAKTDGTCGTYNYDSNTHTITINNVGSDLTFVNKFTVTYEGQEQGTVTKGDTYTHEFTSKWPESITCTGTFGNQTYSNDILTITNVNSNVTCTPRYGEIAITSITYNSSVNATDNNPPVANGMEADFDITFQRAPNATTNDFYIIYDVTIKNEYYEPYIFNGFDFDPEITATSSEDIAYIEPELIGISQGETIPARTTKSFKLKLNLIANNPNGTYGASGSAEAETTEPTVEQGTLTATISPNTGDLRSPNTSATFTVTVTSTYENAKTYSLTSSSSNFTIIGSNNQSLSNLTINGGATDTYTIYVQKSSGAMFRDNTATMNVLLVSDGMANYNAGTLTLNVDISAGVDTTPPSVSNATLAMYNEGSNSYPAVGKLRATWSGQDNQGGSGLLNFTVKLYNSSNTLIDSKTVGSNEFSTTFPTSGTLDDGSYYVVVYGEDNYHNSGASYESQSNSPYVSKTTAAQFKWRFSIDTSQLDDLQCTPLEAYLNQNYVCTMTATGSALAGRSQVPNNVDGVTMGGQALGTNTSATSYYRYNRASNSQATLTVYNVTGDIGIDATASCLVEGTKILLANGSYKNIEDIDYDDLLLVHNYETGSLTKEYPIWIEKEKAAKTYRKSTFSDGSVLKTVGWHGLFSPELNRFITVDNPEEFHVGTKVLKLNKDKTGYDTVTVTNIELVIETVNYYHVVSTRYYNVIANDFLTTDGTTALSNLYGFDKNITWPKDIRNMAMQDMYTYDDLSDTIPYYMYSGLRAEEGKFLANYGLDLNYFKYYLKNNQNNPEMLKKPINNLGRNMWMVTTSIDNVTELNKHNYLRYEGSTYILPQVNNQKFKYWLNTADNKIYYPGDKIKVDHGIYFEAIYK